MSTTYLIRIKKDHAFALIEDLQKVEAIEVIEEESDDRFEIQDWQKKMVLTRLKKTAEHPEKWVSWTVARERLTKLGAQ